MDDKVFEFMEKMYADLKNDIHTVKDELHTVKDELHTVSNRVARLELTIENDIKPVINATLDGYKQLYEKQQEHDKRFDVIERKLDNLSIRVSAHDSKLEVLEGGKKK